MYSIYIAANFNNANANFSASGNLTATFWKVPSSKCIPAIIFLMFSNTTCTWPWELTVLCNICRIFSYHRKHFIHLALSIITKYFGVVNYNDTEINYTVKLVFLWYLPGVLMIPVRSMLSKGNIAYVNKPF